MTIATQKDKRDYYSEQDKPKKQAEIMKVCWTDALDSFGSSKVTKIDNMPIEEIAGLVDTYGHILINRE